jgi:hypothetical protein
VGSNAVKDGGIRHATERKSGHLVAKTRRGRKKMRVEASIESDLSRRKDVK